MEWGAAWRKKLADSTSNALPTLEKIKKSVNDGVQVVNSSMKEAAQQVGGDEIMSKVRGVFDLDALHEEGEAAGRDPSSFQGDEMHFPEFDLTYVTDRLVIMGFPATKRTGNSVKPVADFLNSRHGSDYMVWNISEKLYDYSAYRGQVIDFKFPGYPAPPIGMLFKLCMSMESWLSSDQDNVVVVHCLTGRGRSITVISCLLEWIGKTQRAQDALGFVCDKRGMTLAEALVPSQLRYVSMFHDIMDGIRPRFQPLCVERITVHKVPNMFSAQDRAREDLDLPAQGGCRPYLQIFKNGKLLFTTTWADAQTEQGTPTFPAGPDESFCFETDCYVDGDILIRVRHLDTTSGQGQSMFRYGFHTGYAPIGVLKLGKQDLDGASADPRFPKDICVELEFAVAKDLATEREGRTGAAAAAAAPLGGDPSATLYDDLISSKANFWEEIAKKKALAKERTSSETDALIDTPAKSKKRPQASGGRDVQGSADDGRGSSKEVVEFSILGKDDEDEDYADGSAKSPPSTSRKSSGDSDLLLAFEDATSKVDDIKQELDSLTLAPGGPDAAQHQAPARPPPLAPGTAALDGPRQDAAGTNEVKENSTEVFRSQLEETSSTPLSLRAAASEDDPGGEAADDDASAKAEKRNTSEANTKGDEQVDDVLAELEAFEQDFGTAEDQQEEVSGAGGRKEAAASLGSDPDLDELEKYLSTM